MKNTAVLISYSYAMEVMESDIKTAVFFIGIESVWTDEEIDCQESDDVPILLS